MFSCLNFRKSFIYKLGEMQRSGEGWDVGRVTFVEVGVKFGCLAGAFTMWNCRGFSEPERNKTLKNSDEGCLLVDQFKVL